MVWPFNIQVGKLEYFNTLDQAHILFSSSFIKVESLARYYSTLKYIHISVPTMNFTFLAGVLQTTIYSSVVLDFRYCKSVLDCMQFRL